MDAPLAGRQTLAQDEKEVGVYILHLVDNQCIRTYPSGTFHVLPGCPRLNLWPDAGEALYGSAYMLTCAISMPLFGPIYRFYDVKTVFMASVVVFEVGSAVCGAAPTSAGFIVGRAVAGIGAAGKPNVYVKRIGD